MKSIFQDRFAAAAKDGFKGVEFLFPYEWPAADVAEWREAACVEQALFNAPPGELGEGRAGLSALPGRETEFKDTIGKALEYAVALDCPRIHVMAGLPPERRCRGNPLRNLSDEPAYAASEAAKQDRNVIIEPINTRDMSRVFSQSANGSTPGRGNGRFAELARANGSLSCADRRRRRHNEGSRIHR